MRGCSARRARSRSTVTGMRIQLDAARSRSFLMLVCIRQLGIRHLAISILMILITSKTNNNENMNNDKMILNNMNNGG